MPWYAAVGTVVVGFVAGVLSGMFGVGGAVLTTPGIRALGATPIESVGSTVPAILPGAIAGTVRYARARIVNWRLGLVCGFTGAAFAVAGAWVADLVDAAYLMVVTAVILGWSGVSIFRSARHHPDVHPAESDVEVAAAAAGDGDTSSPAPQGSGERPPIATTTLAVVGAAAGLLAGLLGVGGGIVMMPAFTSVLKVPIKEAVASSLVAIAIFSLPALATHAALGHIHWGYAALLVVGVVPGAQVGSGITIGASDRVVRLLFGAFLVVIAVVYGGTELAGLLS